jgi:hypothetical protein
MVEEEKQIIEHSQSQTTQQSSKFSSRRETVYKKMTMQMGDFMNQDDRVKLKRSEQIPENHHPRVSSFNS